VDKFFKITIGVIGVLMAIIWLRMMIAPMGIAERMAMNPEVPLGLNNIRAFFGLYIGSLAVFLFLTLKKGDKQWLLVPICLEVFSVIGRTGGLIMDGFHEKIVLYIIIEIVLAIFLFAAYRKLPSK
jgi:hypothetical protein